MAVVLVCKAKVNKCAVAPHVPTTEARSCHAQTSYLACGISAKRQHPPLLGFQTITD
jgi:hypothetical protein